MEFNCKCGEKIYITGVNQDYMQQLIESNNTNNDIISYILIEIKRLEAENKKLRECVEFYADEDNWSKYGECEFTQKDIEDCTEENWGVDHYEPELILVAQIGGKKARKTLRELDSDKLFD